jgi:integrase
MLSVAAGGQPLTSLKLRRIQLVRMARDLGGSPTDATTDTLVAWFGGQTGWKTETRRSYRAAVRGFWRWAYRTKRVPHHLADELPTVREHRGAPRPAPDWAYREALAAAEPRVALMLRLAAEAGLRRGEVARVHSRDLLEGAGGAQLLVHGKGGKERVVPLSVSLADAIREYCSGGYVFVGETNGHLSPWWVGDLVQRVLPDGWTMHNLRHRFASRAYRGTRNLRAVQTLLGHSNLSVTERYTAVDDDEIRAAMEAAGA